MKKFWTVLMILACLLTACKSGGEAPATTAPDAGNPTAAVNGETAEAQKEAEGETAANAEDPTEETIDEVMLEIEAKENTEPTAETASAEGEAATEEELGEY